MRCFVCSGRSSFTCFVLSLPSYLTPLLLSSLLFSLPSSYLPATPLSLEHNFSFFFFLFSFFPLFPRILRRRRATRGKRKQRIGENGRTENRAQGTTPGKEPRGRGGKGVKKRRKGRKTGEGRTKETGGFTKSVSPLFPDGVKVVSS